MDPKTKKVLFLLLKLAVSSGALALVFSRTDPGRVIALLGNIAPVFFIAASALYIFSQMVSALRWKLLLPETFRWRRLFSLYMIGAFFSSFLPGVVGGDAVKAYYLSRDSRKLGFALASVFMDRYVGFAGLMLIGICALPFAFGYFAHTPFRWLIPGIFSTFVIGSALFFGLQLGRNFRVAADFYDYFLSIRKRTRELLKVLGLSIIIQFLNFFMVVVLAYGMGENIPLLALVVFLPIVITITSLPISISGLGVREGSFVVLLGLIGIRAETATSLSLAWFFCVFVGSLPGLLLYLGSSDRRDKRSVPGSGTADH